MKIKRMLYLVIIIGLLVSMGAIPVLADDDDTPMWVHRARLVYTGRSSGGPDMMVAYIHIRDANLDMVEDATVSATWKMIDGDPAELPETAITNRMGIAEFGIYEGAGNYEICVTDVTVEDVILEDGTVVHREYDRELNRETCAIYWLPPYPYPYYTKP